MSRAKLRRMLPRVIVNGAVILAMALWIVPTLGLFITSFRPASEVTSSGWWTVQSPEVYPVYHRELPLGVIHRGMTTAFRNSFIITH